MSPAMALYEARMALAEALRNQAVLLEKLAAAEAAELTLFDDPDTTMDAYRQAAREHSQALTARGEGEARIDAAYKRERAALREWVASLGKGR